MIELETIDFASRNAQEMLLTKACTMFIAMDSQVEVLETEGKKLSSWNERENQAVIDRVQNLLSVIIRFKRFLEKVPDGFLQSAPPRYFFHLNMTKDLVEEVLDVEVKVDLSCYLGISVKSAGRLSLLCSRLGDTVRNARFYGIRIMDGIAGKTVISKFPMYSPADLLAFDKPMERRIVELSIRSLPEKVEVKDVRVSLDAIGKILPMFTEIGSVTSIVFENCFFSFDAIFNLSSWLQSVRRVRVVLRNCVLPDAFREQLHDLWYYISQEGMTRWE